jgi:hypothetical protein
LKIFSNTTLDIHGFIPISGLISTIEGAKHLNDHEELTVEAGLPAPAPWNHAVSAPSGGAAPALDLPARAVRGSGADMQRRTNLVRSPDILLTGILDECHFLMREVATESALRAETVQDRLAFVQTGLACARTGAKVAESIAAMQNTPMSVDRANAIVLELARLDRESDSGKQ